MLEKEEKNGEPSTRKKKPPSVANHKTRIELKSHLLFDEFESGLWMKPTIMFMI